MHRFCCFFVFFLIILIHGLLAVETLFILKITEECSVPKDLCPEIPIESRNTGGKKLPRDLRRGQGDSISLTSGVITECLISLSHWDKLWELQVLQGLRPAKARFVKTSFAEPAFSLVRLITSTKHSETEHCAP